MAEKYTAKEIAKALQEMHGNISASAKRLGCSRNTIKRYVEKYPTIADVFEEERETLIDFAENQLFKQVQEGNITAIIFTLKTIGKSRGYVERQEVTGANGGKVQIEYVNDWRGEQ
jgi:predicted transcriptional regulator